jgi:hypothetical protein
MLDTLVSLAILSAGNGGPSPYLVAITRFLLMSDYTTKDAWILLTHRLKNYLVHLRQNFIPLFGCLPEATQKIGETRTRCLMRMLIYFCDQITSGTMDPWTQQEQEIIGRVLKLLLGVIPEVSLLLDAPSLEFKTQALITEDRLWSKKSLLYGPIPVPERLVHVSAIILLRQLTFSEIVGAKNYLLKLGVLPFLLRFLTTKGIVTTCLRDEAVLLVNAFGTHDDPDAPHEERVLTRRNSLQILDSIQQELHIFHSAFTMNNEQVFQNRTTPDDDKLTPYELLKKYAQRKTPSLLADGDFQATVM